MHAAVMTERRPSVPSRLEARTAGVFYLLTFAGGMLALGSTHFRFAANMFGDVAYVVVTLLFYDIFKSVNKGLSALAAIVSLAGCSVMFLRLFGIAPPSLSALVFFGFYCLLIGYLIVKSTFLPKVLGWLMALAGAGWLTYLSPAFALSLQPYNMIPGIVGEGALTLWLLVFGVNANRRNDTRS